MQTTTTFSDHAPDVTIRQPNGLVPQAQDIQSVGQTASAGRARSGDEHLSASTDKPRLKGPGFGRHLNWLTALLTLLSAVLLVLLSLSLPQTRQIVLDSFLGPVLAPLDDYLNKELEAEESNRLFANQVDAQTGKKIDSPKEIAQITAFLSKKYRLASSEVSKFVNIADTVAKKAGLETSLVLAVMSIESNLNPIMESPMGAQGLMQVLTAVHLDKLQPFGGAEKVFDPLTNISVGTQILVNCIKLGGSVEMGLKCYVGATGPTDNGYGLKVLAEKERIEKAKYGVLDFSPNNKVLIDLNIQAGTNQQLIDQIQSSYAPSNAPALHGADAYAFPSSNTTSNQTTGATTSAVVQPLIPAQVTAIPSTTPLNASPAAEALSAKIDKSSIAGTAALDGKQK